jgi:NADH-quinone oxidoreductase subunit C
VTVDQSGTLDQHGATLGNVIQERNERLLAALTSALGAGGRYESWGSTASPGIRIPSIEVKAADVATALKALRDDPAFSFDQLSYLTATDEMPAEPRFRLVYFLLSTANAWRLEVHTKIPESAAKVASVVPLFLGANWMEREVFDMFGIAFEGHPELKRILMPEGYVHHPLRKDFPIEGIEPDRLYRKWERARAAGAEAGGAA